MVVEGTKFLILCSPSSSSVIPLTFLHTLPIIVIYLTAKYGANRSSQKYYIIMLIPTRHFELFLHQSLFHGGGSAQSGGSVSPSLKLSYFSSFPPWPYYLTYALALLPHLRTLFRQCILHILLQTTVVDDITLSAITHNVGLVKTF